MAKATKTIKTVKAPKATKAPKKVVKTKKAVKKQKSALDASDQLYDFIDKLTDEASDEVIKNDGTIGDFIASANYVALSALHHSLFNLKFYGGDNEHILNYVTSLLEDFDNDPEFPAWDDGFDDEECCCGDICNECAAKMQSECPDCRKIQEEADSAAEKAKLLN